MNKHELLDLIGEADEKYVLEADDNVARPRFRWQGWAVCAACVALVAAVAWPHVLPNEASAGNNASADYAPEEAPMAPEGDSEDPIGDEISNPEGTVVQRPGLHEYTLIVGEGEPRIMTTQGTLKAPGDGQDASGENGAQIAGGAYEDEAVDAAPPAYSSQEAPIQQDEASAQHDRLLQWMGGVDGWEPAAYPEWFAGMWLDNDWPDNTARLTVAIVDGFRTEELEEEIRTQAGGTGDVLFCGAKYSQNQLNGLMDQVAQVLEEQSVRIASVYGVCVMDNYLGLEFFGAVPSDEALAALARIDPEGDALRIQVFLNGSLRTTEGEADKGAAPEPAEPTPMTAPEPNSTVPPSGAGGQPQAKYDLIEGAED